MPKLERLNIASPLDIAQRIADIRGKIAEADSETRAPLSEDEVAQHFERRALT